MGFSGIARNVSSLTDQEKGNQLGLTCTRMTFWRKVANPVYYGRLMIKLLNFDGEGLALYQKRLELGTYEAPASGDPDSIRLSSEALLLILQGIRLDSVRRRKRYSHRPLIIIGI